MNLGAVFFVGNLTCSFHMLDTWPTQFYVGPPTLTFLATLVLGTTQLYQVQVQDLFVTYMIIQRVLTSSEM